MDVPPTKQAPQLAHVICDGMRKGLQCSLSGREGFDSSIMGRIGPKAITIVYKPGESAGSSTITKSW